MGREAACTARFGGKSAAGKALLETKEVVFRGEGLRFAIPYAGLTRVEARGDTLELRAPAGTAELELGAREAAHWARWIKNPPGRLDKLGVKPGMKVWVVGALDPAFLAELRARTEHVRDGKTKAGAGSGPFDLVFFAAEAPADLKRLATLKKTLQPAGALWVVRAKGAAARVSEAAVMAAGKAAGLVDTKVVAFSESHTAERLVIPVAHR
jgi:hypothetical protein